jgi:ubiquinone/menaquinone biosynthesis C-methylase UbiE
MTCISCGADQTRALPKQQARAQMFPDRTLVQCVQCGLAWPDPLPSYDDIRAIYESDSLIHEYVAGGITYVAGSDQAEPYIVDRIEKVTARAGKPGRMLDIGAARGAYLKACQDRGWQVTGIELSPEGRDYAREKYGMEFHNQPLETLAFPDGSFDAVHMNHVLEHLVDPAETLREIHRVLSPGGLLVVEVPNEIDEFFVAVCTAFGRPPEPYSVASPHVYHFNARSLTNVLNKAGFLVYHLSTPRRNANTASRIPLGSLFRRLVFWWEGFIKRGPVVLTFSQKR